MHARITRTLVAASLAIALGACGSTRTVSMRVLNHEGEPIVGALVNAAPLGVSVSPLPVSFENLREAETNRGTGGVTDREGEIRLTLERSYEYEIRIQPAPMSAGSLNGDAWVWTLGADGRTFTRREGRASEAQRPVLEPLDEF